MVRSMGKVQLWEGDGVRAEKAQFVDVRGMGRTPWPKLRLTAMARAGTTKHENPSCGPGWNRGLGAVLGLIFRSATRQRDTGGCVKPGQTGFRVKPAMTVFSSPGSSGRCFPGSDNPSHPPLPPSRGEYRGRISAEE